MITLRIPFRPLGDAAPRRVDPHFSLHQREGSLIVKRTRVPGRQTGYHRGKLIHSFSPTLGRFAVYISVPSALGHALPTASTLPLRPPSQRSCGTRIRAFRVPKGGHAEPVYMHFGPQKGGVEARDMWLYVLCLWLLCTRCISIVSYASEAIW